MKRLAYLVAVSLLSGPAVAIDAKSAAKPPAATAAAKSGAGVRELDWEDLVPPESRLKLGGGPPPPIHDYLGEGGLPAQQVMDFSVNKELHGAQVKLPGFIVPLEINKNQLITEFFLVPYVGACIHVPPPPPNQIVYVKVDKGVAIDSIWEAYWVTGKLAINNTTTRLGASAYQLTAEKIEIYKF
ncbi:MAG: DUF3299 domain-containing protein [Steroidobacteraceae bacterium]|nr:DUF3299 domain-containing protein [Steroidobacteraceae bacterium]MDW8258431.1 DUF3299 domain-containing protein [Gammaproteobacteria bacterium]